MATTAITSIVPVHTWPWMRNLLLASLMQLLKVRRSLVQRGHQVAGIAGPLGLEEGYRDEGHLVAPRDAGRKAGLVSQLELLAHAHMHALGVCRILVEAVEGGGTLVVPAGHGVPRQHCGRWTCAGS